MAARKVVWEGPQAFRRLLVPIDELKPNPRNARVGNVDAVAQSLERFGQLVTVAVGADGILQAGHTRLEAARQLGWTHLAAAPNELQGAEAEAFAIADNRTSDLAGYDERKLLDQLRAHEEAGTLLGTGYVGRDVELLRVRVDAALAREQAQDPPYHPPPPDPRADFRCPSCGHEWDGSPRP